MTDQDLFRAILGATIVARLPFLLWGATKHHRPARTLDPSRRGNALVVTLRLVGAGTLVAMLLFVFRPDWIAWATFPLPVAGRWVGVGLQLTAIGLAHWSQRAFQSRGARLIDTVLTEDVPQLVIVGPYRWVRHPFYTAMILTALSVGLMAANWLFLVAAALFATMFAIRSRLEEQRLIERFGAEYQHYMTTSGRFLPRWAKGISEG